MTEMRVLCADCGHREAMPKGVAKLAMESGQDPKCPRCKSANLTVDAPGENGRRRVTRGGEEVGYVEPYRRPGQDFEGGVREWRYVRNDGEESLSSFGPEDAVNRLAVRKTANLIVDASRRRTANIDFADMAHDLTVFRDSLDSMESDEQCQLLIDSLGSFYQELVNSIGIIPDDPMHRPLMSIYGAIQSLYDWKAGRGGTGSGDPLYKAYDLLDDALRSIERSQRTGARRHTASDPRDPEMQYGPESGYWEAEDEMYRDNWIQAEKDQMEYDRGADYMELRGWEFSDETDSAYGEYVREFLGDDEELREREDLAVSARRRVASESWETVESLREGDVVDVSSLLESLGPDALGDDYPGSTLDMARYETGVVSEVGSHLPGTWPGAVGLELVLGGGLEYLILPTGTRILKSSARRRSARRKVAYGSGTPQVWIASLSDYNNGKLVGKWVDATSLSSLEQGAEEVLAMSTDPFAEELAIHDYDNFGAFTSMLGEYPNYNDVVAAAQLIQDHGDVALAAAELSDSVEEAADLVDEYYGQFSSDREFAQEFVDSIGVDNLSNPEAYFDYARWGRDVAEEWSWSEDDDDPDPSLESLRENYRGDHRAWAEEMIDDMGGVGQLDQGTLESYFDFDSFASDLMYDYHESGGHYFRAI